MKIAYKFARAGKVFKELSEEDATLIPHLIKVGEILPTDDYWMPGMQTWNKVSLRDWDAPATSDTPATPKPAPTPQPIPQQQKPAAAAPAQNQTRRAALHECMSCKKTFNEPAKAVSGYTVIGKAVKFFLISVAVQIVIGVIVGIYTTMVGPFGSPIGMILVGLVVFALAIVALGLFLMAVFELISASVTHGLYRANPERCPNCGSTTFSR
ncbi:MAG: hypothetical protein RI910_2354 [Verrucomicrobiota bacterium]|jgi:hypothetical protein